MTRRHLEIFIAVAEEGSMTGAAKRLFIAQPTVSQCIKDLELEQEVQVFERIGKQLYLTREGKTMLSYARYIMALYREMEQQLTAVGKREWKIGCTLTVGEMLLPELIPAFRQHLIGSQMHTVIRNTSDIQEALLNNHIDFGIVEGEIRHPDIRSENLVEDYLICVCGKEHPLYGKGVDNKLLSGERFLLRERGSGTRLCFEQGMQRMELSFVEGMECNSFGPIIAAAKAGIGIGVVSDCLVKEALDRGDLWQLNEKESFMTRMFTLVYHKNKYISSDLEKLFGIIRENAIKGSV